MPEFKVNIGHPKSGKTHKKDIVGTEADALLNMKIGEKVIGDKIGFPGYEFQITGGSDKSGFPMRWDVSGNLRKRILIASGVGTRHNRAGMRLRRTVAPNMINEKTVQINMKVLKEGKTPLEAPVEEVAPEGEAPTEASPEAKEEKAPETPKEEAKEEKPSEDKKEEAKKE